MDNAITLEESRLSWIDTFTGILFSPQQTFQRLVAENSDGTPGLFGAAIVVVLGFGLAGLRATAQDHMQWSLFNFSTFAGFGLYMWGALAGVLGILASCFGTPSLKVKTAFVTIGWAFVPYLFLAPLWCYRGVLGQAFVLIAQLPLLWVFILQLLAIRTTFDLKPWQVLSLAFLAPVLYQIYWLIQFLQNTFLSISALSS